LFAKDYVRNLFCPKLVTDYIEAQGSMLFDSSNNIWDSKLLSLAHLDISQMPEIVSPLDIIGHVSEWASKKSGLSTTTKVICGSTDTAMEVLASGGIKKGDMTLKLATAGRICLVTDRPYPDKNIINYSHLNKGLYYPGSGTKSCASSLRWFRDAFGGSYKELDKLAKDAPVGSDGLIFLPYLMGELTPYGNPNIKGCYFGISSLHSKKHFVKALLEGVALSLLDCYIYLSNQGMDLSKKAFVLGGGSKSPLWCQIVSDVLGIELVVTENNDSSFGDSLCAATACHNFSSLNDAINKTQKIISTVKPNMDNHQKYLEIYKKYKKIADFSLKFYN
jgi:xylulokinase